MENEPLEKYGTITAWQEELGLSIKTIRNALKGIEGIEAFTKRKTLRLFYSETTIREACSRYLQEIPQANNDGFFQIETDTGFIRYGTNSAWAAHFNVSQPVTEKRLRGIVGITAKTAIGHVLENGFYPENIVLERCSDIFQDLPTAGLGGFFIQATQNGEEKFGTVSAWSKELVTSPKTIQTRITQEAGILGKNGSNSIATFYSESVIRRHCSDILRKFAVASEDGFLVLTGSDERYGLPEIWSDELLLSLSSIRRRLEGVVGITAKSKSGVIIENGFYSETQVREKCFDLLRNLPESDESGFFILREDGQDVRYGTSYVWSIELGISNSFLIKQLEKVKGITGRDRGRKVRENGFYSEEQIQTACIPLTREMPKADVSGFFIFQESGFEEEVYGSRHAWSTVLPIDYNAICKRLEGTVGVTGKNVGGLILENGFYRESLVMEKCADLLEDLPQADETNFLKHSNKDGLVESHATIKRWCDTLSIPEGSASKLLSKFESVALTAKAYGGQIVRMFPESLVRSVCADFFLEYPEEGIDGFLYPLNAQNPERHGTCNAWANILSITGATILKRLKNAQVTGIDGKKSGRIFKCIFYSESAVRRACADLLVDMPQADEDGFFIIENERYGTAQAWSRELSTSDAAVRYRMRDCIGISGKDSQGILRENTFYKESDIKRMCLSIGVELPQISADGFIIMTVNDHVERYATSNTWSKIFKIATNTFKGCMQGIEPKEIIAKDSRGRVIEENCYYYAESDACPACSHFLEELKQADDSKFYNGEYEDLPEKFGTISAWSDLLLISDKAISRALEGIKGKTAKDSRGKIIEKGFFPETVVRNKCAHLLQILPQVDENGFFLLEKEGVIEKHASLVKWGEIFNVSWNTMKKVVAGVPGITARLRTGRIVEGAFYAESVVTSLYEKYKPTSLKLKSRS